MQAKQCTRCDRAVPEHKALSVEIRVPQIYEDDAVEYVTVRADVCSECANGGASFDGDVVNFRQAVGLGSGQEHEMLWEVLDGVDPREQW